ncbi:endolytic transglycosylase MltG [Caminicella sporogenes]|uniref:endolytic transglycosylase MltG n=1 Tax=Caminicella sporogenes TaxID=166485 RepID=UPI0025415BF3|nr:endolytic transglycosylase MltG [Caminicella sporogenes]WIF94502.1 endolytic transglycosylase MltG [Caminicella sporogenes]
MDSSINKGRSLIIKLSIFIIALVALLFYFNSLKGPVDKNDNKNIIINIPRGSSSSKIASILKENHLIKSKFVFKLVSKQKKADNLFKAGSYRFKKSMSMYQIIDKIISGDVYKETVRITIPEGFELKQIVDRIVNNDKLNIDREKLMYVIENGDFDFKFLKGIPKGKNRLEGFLFPDTYEFEKNITEKEIIYKMLKRFDEVFKKEYYERAEQLNMSVVEVVTLASIIEKEAKLDEERAIISSVFHNRLKKNMLLQSCATVQYALGKRKERLTYKDLEINSPFNTYKRFGLPPMPIASPGKASIKAALYPADTDYLYFVSNGDGSHSFSKSYSAHLRAKNRNY